MMHTNETQTIAMPQAGNYRRFNMGLTARKDVMGGALNMGLLASNTDQLLTLVTAKSPNFDPLDLTKISLLSTSLLLQVGNNLFLYCSYHPM